MEYHENVIPIYKLNSYWTNLNLTWVYNLNSYNGQFPGKTKNNQVYIRSLIFLKSLAKSLPTN